MTKDEVRKVIAHLSGTHQLMTRLLYGSGLRLMECLRLRVKDLDFAQRQIIVRDGKGQQDRITMMPKSLVLPLQEHLQHVKRLHEQDLARGYGKVYLPDALARKYPSAAWEWIKQYVFPSQRLSGEPVRPSVASCGKRNPVFGKHRVSDMLGGLLAVTTVGLSPTSR